MPDLRRVLSCAAPYGKGGLGQHFAQLVEEARSSGALARYFSPRPKAGDAAGHPIALWTTKALYRVPPVRFSTSIRTHIKGEEVDRRVASALSTEDAAGGAAFVGFGGKSLRSFRRARALGFGRLELVVANTHVDRIRHQHEWARRDSGIGDSWLSEGERRKTLWEYEEADRILVHSDYVRQSLVEGGVPEAKLRRMDLEVDARFVPPTERPDDGVFRVVYVGRVDGTKGVPLLLRAFAALPLEDKELTVVGGPSSRALRKALEQAQAETGRVVVAPGDPLEALQRADVFVHPTYEDGFGYAPMEALACGTPVVVTEDTGMKEHVREGESGYVVPTGDLEALVERMLHVHRHPLARTASFLSPTRPPAPNLAAA